jgi:hypothetical protein
MSTLIFCFINILSQCLCRYYDSPVWREIMVYGRSSITLVVYGDLNYVYILMLLEWVDKHSYMKQLLQFVFHYFT